MQIPDRKAVEIAMLLMDIEDTFLPPPKKERARHYVKYLQQSLPNRF